jgi:hypothetical protein
MYAGNDHLVQIAEQHAYVLRGRGREPGLRTPLAG